MPNSLPEDIIHLIYKKYHDMFVLPEVVKRGKMIYRRVTPSDHHEAAPEDRNVRCVVGFLRVGSRSHGFWDLDPLGLKTSHTVGTIDVEFDDDSWSAEKKEAATMALARELPVFDSSYDVIEVIVRQVA